MLCAYMSCLLLIYWFNLKNGEKGETTICLESYKVGEHK
jgi:hypothetical protein